jgi:hypothetical protein
MICFEGSNTEVWSSRMDIFIYDTNCHALQVRISVMLRTFQSDLTMSDCENTSK